MVGVAVPRAPVGITPEERQRRELAAALAARPSQMVLDESGRPTLAKQGEGGLLQHGGSTGKTLTERVAESDILPGLQEDPGGQRSNFLPYNSDIGFHYPQAVVSVAKALTAGRHALEGGSITGEDVGDFVGSIAMPGVAKGTIEGAMLPKDAARKASLGMFYGEGAYMRPEEIAALAKAKELHAKGVGMEEIRSGTGFHLDPLDNKWRGEFSDKPSAMTQVAKAAREATATESTKPNPTADDVRPEVKALSEKYGMSPSIWRHKDVDRALKDVHEDLRIQGAPREELDLVDAEAQRLWDMKPKTTAETTLGEVLDHPELYEKYPELKSAPMTLSERRDLSWAEPNLDYINLGRHREGDRSVALHEVQHLIQGREGFTRGSNPDEAARLLPSNARLEQAARTKQEYDLFLLDHMETLLPPEVREGMGLREMSKILNDPEEMVRRAAQSGLPDDKLDKLISLAAQRKIDDALPRTPQQAYEYVGGEAEARNVQARKNMTPEQLRATPLAATADVPMDRRLLPPKSQFAASVRSAAFDKPQEPEGPRGLAAVRARVADKRISTRRPTSKKTEGIAERENLLMDDAAYRADPNMPYNTALLKEYPGMRMRQSKPESVLDEFQNRVADNLRFLMEMVPESERKRTRQWYDGANRFAKALSARYKVPEEAASAVIAAMSPQKDWFQNASLAERVVDTVLGQRGKVLSAAEANEVARAYPAIGKNADAVSRISGKTIDEIEDPTDAALFVRMFDHANRSPHYRELTPEGMLGDFIKSGSGENQRVGWGSLNEIGKGIRALRDSGLKTISELMGEKHKIRNFYNNIVAPNARHGDTTIDTHAVAAALFQPLSGASAPVMHALDTAPLSSAKPAGWRAAKGSDLTGARGTYGAYMKPYATVASEYGILPREVQSITWEQIRKVFEATMKRDKKAVAAVQNTWKEFDGGKISADAARARILDIVQYRPSPTGGGYGGKLIAPEKGSTFGG